MLPHVHNIHQYAAKQKFLKIIQTDLISSRLDGDEKEQVTALYNSKLSFSERLYDMLDMGLSPICLLKPLETIMKVPLVFIRNTVPHTCLEAMKRYNCIYTQRTDLLCLTGFRILFSWFYKLEIRKKTVIGLVGYYGLTTISASKYYVYLDAIYFTKRAFGVAFAKPREANVVKYIYYIYVHTIHIYCKKVLMFATNLLV